MAMECLSSEVILQILEHVSIYDKLTSVQFVSKRFHALVWDKHAFQEIDFEREPYFSGQEEQKLLQKCKRTVRKVNFKQLESKAPQKMITILSNCCNLTELKVTNLNLDCKGLIRILKKLKKLDTLSMNEYAEAEMHDMKNIHDLKMRLSHLSINCTQYWKYQVLMLGPTDSFLKAQIVDSDHKISTLTLTWPISGGLASTFEKFVLRTLYTATYHFEYVSRIELFFNLSVCTVQQFAKNLTMLLMVLCQDEETVTNFSALLGKYRKTLFVNVTYNTESWKIFEIGEGQSGLTARLNICSLPLVFLCYGPTNFENLFNVEIDCNNSDNLHISAGRTEDEAFNYPAFLESHNLFGVKEITCVGKLDNEPSAFLNNLGKSLANFASLTVLRLDLWETKQTVLETFLLHCKHPELLMELGLSLHAIPVIDEHKHCQQFYCETDDLSDQPPAKRKRVNRRVGCSSLWLLARKCPNLKVFFIYGFHRSLMSNKTNSHSLEAISEMKHLRELELADIEQLDEHTFLESIFKNCSNLVKISLRDVGPSAMLKFRTVLINHVKHLKNLESFELIHQNIAIDSKLLAAFNENIFLQKLSLRAQTGNIEWKGFASAFKLLISKLRYLTLFQISTKYFAESHRKKLISSCKHRHGLKTRFLPLGK